MAIIMVNTEEIELRMTAIVELTCSQQVMKCNFKEEFAWNKITSDDVKVS